MAMDITMLYIFSIISISQINTVLPNKYDENNPGWQNKYIITFKPNQNTKKSNYLPDLKVAADNTSITIMQQLQIGNKQSILVDMPNISSLTSTNILADNVLSIEQNIKLEMFSHCALFFTGLELWGLGRLSQDDGVHSVEEDSIMYPFSTVENQTDVYVFIMDSGIYLEHDEFEGRAKWSFTASDVKYEGDGDLNGHGTHVAGTVAGKIYGVAKQVNVRSVKVLNEEGQGSLFGLLECIEFVTSEYHRLIAETGSRPKLIVNMSLGVRASSDVVRQAIEESISLGIVYIAAAGNSADDACRWTPSSIKGVITVGATDSHDNLSGFSNYGSCVDILAPGVDIKSSGISGKDSTRSLQGTSMAAPHVAGVIARYLSYKYMPPSCISNFLKQHSNINKINIPSSRKYTPNWLLHVRTCDTGFGEEEQCLEEPMWDVPMSVLNIVLISVGWCLVAVAGIIVIVMCVMSKSMNKVTAHTHVEAKP